MFDLNNKDKIVKNVINKFVKKSNCVDKSCAKRILVRAKPKPDDSSLLRYVSVENGNIWYVDASSDFRDGANTTKSDSLRKFVSLYISKHKDSFKKDKISHLGLYERMVNRNKYIGPTKAAYFIASRLKSTEYFSLRNEVYEFLNSSSLRYACRKLGLPADLSIDVYRDEFATRDIVPSVETLEAWLEEAKCSGWELPDFCDKYNWPDPKGGMLWVEKQRKYRYGEK